MKLKPFTIFLLLLLGASACGSTPTGEAGLGEGKNISVWFDAPIPGTVFWPPNPCQIVIHGSSPSGISFFVITIKDSAPKMIPSPDKINSLVTLTMDCGVSEPGEYLVQAKVQDNDGNWSEVADTNFSIAGEERSPESPTDETSGPTATMTSPEVPIVGNVSIERLSTNLVYIGRPDCGAMDVTITARIVTPSSIVVVMIYYRFNESGSPTEYLNDTLVPIGGDLFQVTLNPSDAVGGSIPFDEATLQYQVIIQQTDGDTSLRTPLLGDIQVRACN